MKNKFIRGRVCFVVSRDSLGYCCLNLVTTEKGSASVTPFFPEWSRDSHLVRV